MAIKDANAIAKGLYDNLSANSSLATLNAKTFFGLAEQSHPYPYITFAEQAGSVFRRQGCDDMNRDIWRFSVFSTSGRSVQAIETEIISSLANNTITIGTMTKVGIVRESGSGPMFEQRTEKGIVYQKTLLYQIWTT